LTYVELVDAVLGTRFNSGQRPQAKQWLKQRYSDVWAAATWPFKIVGPTNLTVTAADDTPTLPLDLLRPIAIWDDQGNRLVYLEPETFWHDNEGSTATGTPSSYTWVNGVVHLAPTPSATLTFTIAYRRRLSHKNAAGAVVVGPMSLDTDEPIWDEEEYDHGFLIDGAYSLGLTRENDPSADGAEGHFQAGLIGMLSELTDPVAALQFAADPLE
jgi:hypothetical protein